MKREDLAAVFEQVKVLPLRPTDVLVLRTPRTISQAQEQMVREAVQELTGHANVLVLDGGADVDVIRPTAPWWRFW